MFPPGAPVLVLVSGGADSVALLHLLASGDLGHVGPISVLHVNHLLRGADADADAAFVESLSADLDVPCTVVRFDVPGYAAGAGLNLEDAGRRVRYRFGAEALDAACAAADVSPEAGRIAVAHNRDDRVETFLMRAITGSGAAGLSSIPYRRDRIVRPLLDCDRAAIRRYLEELGQPWREDVTNADTTHLRALVRAEMVPVAERVNPAFRETLCRSIDLLADDDALLSGMAADFAQGFGTITPGERIELDLGLMATLDRTMVRRTIRSALAEAFPCATRIEAFHIEAIADGIGVGNFARDLPCGLRVWTEYGKLIVSVAEVAEAVLAPSLLSLPGMIDLGLSGTMRAEKVSAGDILGETSSVTVDARDARSFVVDAVRPGDRMRPFGMDGTRKVSDLLIDAKVPRQSRLLVPVVRDGERIVWLAGVRMSEEYRVRPDTTNAVRLTWHRPENLRPAAGECA